MKARLPQNMQPNNMNQMLKQAQKMQEDMATLQEDLKQREYTASAGGVVEVTITGEHKIQKLTIKPEAVDPEDVEMLEDYITIAVNEAISKAEKTADEEMSSITAGMNLPGVL